jgi:protein SCO1/2
LADKQQAVVRHEAYGGMPAMTMLFALSARDAARLHQGDRIEATVDERGDLETLSNVRLIGKAVAPRSDTLHSVALLKTGDALPAIPLIDQNGRPFTFADFRGKTVVLSFIYTRCRDTRMCPLISAHFHQLQQRLNGNEYHLVEVTLDPAFDRPPVLANYAVRFDADASRWTIGTGDPRAVLNFAAQFGIVPFPDPSVGLIHSERTALIGRDGRIADFMDEAGWDPNNVIARLQMMNNVPANPIALMDYVLSKGVVAVCGNEVAGTSGLLDLVVVAIIFSGGVWILIRIGRFMLRTKT